MTHYSQVALFSVLVTTTLSTTSSFLYPSLDTTTVSSNTITPSFARGKSPSHLVLSSNDDFFDGYDEFVSSLDFNEGGWNKDNPIRNGTGGNDYGDRNQRRGGGGGRDGRRGGRGGASGGHDYERAQDDDTSNDGFDSSKVQNLISERLNYRKTGRFDEADDIRDTLRQEFGVTLWDKEKVWTTNANRRGGSNRHSSNGRYGDRQNDGRRGGGSFNNRRERAPKDFGPSGHDYNQVGELDSSVCTLSVSEIDSMLAERLQAKMSRDFETADGIQSELRNQGVSVVDGIKEWRADGEEWLKSPRRNDERGGNGGYNQIREYAQRGPCRTIPEEEVSQIREQIVIRSEHKANRDYDAADEIKFALSDKYDITIDDKKLSWAVRSEEYLLSSDSIVVPSEEIQLTIGKELGLRIVAKQDRDFDAADAIRDELYDKYNAVLNDRLKEYTIEPNEDEEEVDAWGEETEDAVEEATMDVEEDDAEEEEEEDTEEQMTEDELLAMTVPILKEKLRSAGLPVSGKKAELVERLLTN